MLRRLGGPPAAISAAVVLLAVVGCADPTPTTLTATIPAATAASARDAGVSAAAASASPAATPPPSARPTTAVRTTAAASAASVGPPRANAVIRPVGVAQWRRIVAAGMAHRGCPATRTRLRRVEVGYWGFDGRVHRGVLVVNADVSASTAAIFTRLFASRFPIRSMRPVEDFHGDDNASMAADNTSAYNCRSAAQANSPAARSPHANGRAIDIDPLENPWRDPHCRCWMPSARYAVHRAGRGVIVQGGVVWTAFHREHWIWQDIAGTVDFQHFDTGYPSRPFHRGTAA